MAALGESAGAFERDELAERVARDALATDGSGRCSAPSRHGVRTFDGAKEHTVSPQLGARDHDRAGWTACASARRMQGLSLKAGLDVRAPEAPSSANPEGWDLAVLGEAIQRSLSHLQVLSDLLDGENVLCHAPHLKWRLAGNDDVNRHYAPADVPNGGDFTWPTGEGGGSDAQFAQSRGNAADLLRDRGRCPKVALIPPSQEAALSDGGRSPARSWAGDRTDKRVSMKHSLEAIGLSAQPGYAQT